jgi:citrate synthase
VLADALPERSRPRDTSIAARLWSRLGDAPPSPSALNTLDAALVLLADHELAASTLAARVAASAWADPYLVVLTGLGALGGALHGASAGAAEAMLASIGGPEDAGAALGERLRADGRVPGFGLGVYRDRDPRADALLALLPRAASPERVAIVEEVVRLVGRRDGPAPNVDFALAALSVGCALCPGAAEAIFSIARVAGLVAHAIEEYPHRLRFRPRAAYTGPAPRA